jgi:tetratricopeptide (TPR) repeat protein
MKFYILVIRYRFWLSIAGLAIAILLNVTGSAGFWPSFPLYFVSVIGLVSHFLIGPLRLAHGPMEEGELEEVEKILASVWYPKLLIKPVRSGYYTIKGQIAMASKDFDNAEKYLKESSSLGTAIPQAEGSNKLQLGMMAMQRNDFKGAEGYIRASLRFGLVDKDSEAVAYLSLCQIYMNKRQFKASKDFFRKAKECKPKSKQVLDQIKEIDKYVSRMQ